MLLALAQAKIPFDLAQDFFKVIIHNDDGPRLAKVINVILKWEMMVSPWEIFLTLADVLKYY